MPAPAVARQVDLDTNERFRAVKHVELKGLTAAPFHPAAMAWPSGLSLVMLCEILIMVERHAQRNCTA